MATNLDSDDIGTPLLNLAAGVVTTVTFARDLTAVEVIHVSGTDPVWYSIDGSVPTVGGTNCYMLTPGDVDTRDPAGKTNELNLISAGAVTVRVQRGF